MAEIVMLDAGPLGMICHPRPTDAIGAWLARLVGAGIEVLVPEIADYEVRRELLRAKHMRSLTRLEDLKQSLGYIPITTAAMLIAAEFWAQARRRGRPTARDNSLDADAILAGQAAVLSHGTIMVATTNPRHLSQFVPAEYWSDIVP